MEKCVSVKWQLRRLANGGTNEQRLNLMKTDPLGDSCWWILSQQMKTGLHVTKTHDSCL